MLEEYLLDKINALEILMEECNKTLHELTRQEESINKEISDLIENDDVGRELFSPRNANHDVKKLIAEKRHTLEDIQVEQLKVQAQVESAVKRIDQYQQILLEYRNKGEAELLQEQGANSAQGRETVYRAALEETLKRLDKCAGLIYNDKLKCKNEIKNLRYYIKAVLSNAEENGNDN